MNEIEENVHMNALGRTSEWLAWSQRKAVKHSLQLLCELEGAPW